MATVSAVVDEIRESKHMVLARSLTAGGGTSDIQGKLAMSFARKICNMGSMQAIHARQLLEAVNDSGLHAAGKSSVTAAIDAKLASTLEDDVGSKPSATNQLCTTPEHYATTSLITSFASKTMRIDTKIIMLAEFLIQLGLVNPHEQTYKYWLAFLVLLHFEDRFPAYKAIHTLLLDLKDNVHTGKRTPSFAIIKKYPEL